MSMWMVRAGEAGHALDFFLDSNVVAIGWSELGNLSDLTQRTAVATRVNEVWPENSASRNGMWTGIVHRFRNVLSVDDEVLTYDPSTRVYHVGKISSDYHFNPTLRETMPNTREVVWEGQVNRDSLPVPAKNELGAIMALFKVSDTTSSAIRALLAGQSPAEAAPDEEVEPVDEDSLLRDIQARSKEFIKDELNRVSWEDMQEIVAGLLRAMGYKTKVSPPGSDLGRDIVASPDGFGFEQPRIVVEVKHRAAAIGSQQIRSFLGGRHPDDKGLYVSTGGFTKDAKYEADRAAIPLTLMDLDDLVTAIIEHYEEMDIESRAILPLVNVYWPS